MSIVKDDFSECDISTNYVAGENVTGHCKDIIKSTIIIL